MGLDEIEAERKGNGDGSWRVVTRLRPWFAVQTQLLKREGLERPNAGVLGIGERTAPRATIHRSMDSSLNGEEVNCPPPICFDPSRERQADVLLISVVST